MLTVGLVNHDVDFLFSFETKTSLYDDPVITITSVTVQEKLLPLLSL